MKGFFMKFDI